MTEAIRQPAGGGPCAGQPDYLSVVLVGEASVARRLAPLFSGGVGVDVVAGCSVRALLTEQLAMDSDYVDGRLQTLFLNGHPIDDIDAARVNDGDVLALSAAMPGLVGATMRRGGRYAVLRQEISHTAQADCTIDAGPICLTLKLFNLIAGEVAPVMLERGVWLAGDRLAGHIDIMGRAVVDALTEVRMDGRRIDPAALTAQLPAHYVLLRVMTC